MALLLTTTLSAPAEAQFFAKRDSLRKTEAELEASREKTARLQQNLDALETELTRLGKDVTSIARELQNNERALSDNEAALDILEAERAKKKDALQARSQQLSAMLSAIIRVNQIPREAAVLMPASFTDRAAASRAIGLTSGALKEDMDSLILQMAELKQLETTIAGKRNTLERQQATLEERRAALRGIITRRRSVMESLYAENITAQKRIAALVSKSQSLHALVSSLEKERREQRDTRFAQIGRPEPKPTSPSSGIRRTTRKVVSRKPGDGDDFAEARGTLRLPVSGNITGTFGQSRGKNDTLKGIEITARNGAQVTAPFEAEVMFTGPFLEYGNMVILRHDGGYHTLLAGFDEIDCVPGQSLHEGEPMGALSRSTARPILYLELRENGTPINPKPWITGFSSLLAQR